MNIFKKTAAAVTAAVLIAVLVPHASAAGIYDIESERTIATGIVHKSIKRLTASGWQNINIIEADLSGGRYGVKTLTDTENISKLANVKNLASSHGTLAAINGDFFSWKWDDRSMGSAIGGMVIDGVQHTSLTSPWNFATVAQKNDGAFIFDYIDCAVAVAAPNGFITPIEHINKYDDLTQPIIYTKEWGPTSPGSAGTLSEIVIEDDTVVSVNYDAGPVPIPENGYIIAFLRDVTPELLDNFFVGDKVEIGINYEPKFEDIRFAVGAGTLLLKDGERAKNVNDIPGNHPRTAIGINSDHTKLYLVTVDGRQTNAKGVTLSGLAEIMSEIGAHHAANLDGGGSTTMVVRSPYSGEQEVSNSPSDNYLRPVANGIGIVPAAEADEDGFITIETDSDCVFAGTKLYLNAKVRDSLGNVTDGEIEWSATEGTVVDGYYISDMSGRHVVTASSGSMSATKELHVIDNPVKISAGLSEYEIGVGEGAYISLTATDDMGYTAYVNLSDAGITLSSPILEVEGNTLKGIEAGTAVATFDLGSAQTSVLVRVGGDKSKVVIPPDVSVPDSLTTPVGDGTFKLAVFGNTTNKNTLTEKLVMKKYTQLLDSNYYDLAVFAGPNSAAPRGVEFNNITASAHYSYADYGDATVITLNSADTSQWEIFLREAQLVRTKHLFIVMPEGINDDSGYLEEMLIDFVNKTFGDIKVYVISAGDASVVSDTGIKHIKVPGIEQVRNAGSAAEDAHYHLFTIDGDNVSMEKIKMWE